MNESVHGGGEPRGGAADAGEDSGSRRVRREHVQGEIMPLGEDVVDLMLPAFAVAGRKTLAKRREGLEGWR
jgi:hypothetical protein